MSGTKLVIWDWNGTLLNDVVLNLEITNKMLQKRGIPPLKNLEDYRNAFHFPIIEYYESIGFCFDTESYETVAEEYHQLYTRQVHGCALYPNAEGILATIQSNGIPQILASATQHDRLVKQVADCGITNYFSELFGQKDGLSYGKTETVRQVLQQYRIAPSSVIMVGDTTHDAEIAHTLETRCVLFTAGHQNREKLSACNVPMVDSLSDLSHYL